MRPHRVLIGLGPAAPAVMVEGQPRTRREQDVYILTYHTQSPLAGTPASLDALPPSVPVDHQAKIRGGCA